LVPSEPPRPYLSDLAVHSHYRRKGIATALLLACEEQAQNWGHGNIFLRVEKHNNAKAKEMYFSRGYDYVPHEYFGVDNLDDTLLLRLDLNAEESTQSYRHKDETLAFTV
jgi:ribosomal protein S18 acetylase RimI-like enzyme